MTTREICSILEQARKLNFVGYVAWGGEPLIRPDTLEILRHAHDLGLYTSFITNGTYLSEYAEEIAKTVDLTFVSLDHPSEYHDELRGSKDCYHKAMTGILKLRNLGGRITVNCVLSKLNHDIVRDMAALAQAINVGIAFDPMEVFSGFNEEYALSPAERRHAFLDVLKAKKAGYPVLNSFEFLENLINPAEYSCAQAKVYINVRENGDVNPFWCHKSERSVGNLRRQSLAEVLVSPEFREFGQKTEKCWSCVNSVTTEVSMFYSVPKFFKNCFRLPSPIWSFISYYGLNH
jgi:pyrroloquinoline quinone biosynthesis protein E